MRFLQDIAPVQQAVSLWFEAIDKVKYKSYRDQVDMMVKADTGRGAFKFANSMAFLGVASLRNILSHNHKDAGDNCDGWAAMTCVGDFTGGELCFPDLDVKLRYLPGDVILFRASMLQHFVKTTSKSLQRTFFQIFKMLTPTHSWRAQLPRLLLPLRPNQHRAKRPLHGRRLPRTHQAREEKKEQFQRKQERVEKYKKYSHLPQYPVQKEDLTVREMRKAYLRQYRFIKFATREAKRGE